MRLTLEPRTQLKKSATKKIRKEGHIPAILYTAGQPSEPLIVNGTEFSAILRQIKQGRLPTTIFSLSIAGKEKRAIIKDIQYHLTTYTVSHLDFEQLHDDLPVSVKVPIRYTGVVDCVGIKLGGFLRPIVRFVNVKCLPKQIPEEFQVDVKDLGIRQSKRLKDISMPKGVKPLTQLDEVIVTIAKR